VGAVVLAFSAEGLLFGDDCCSGQKWQSHTAQYKFEELWNKLLQNLTPNTWPSVEKFALIFVESMDPSFDRVADDLPIDRAKLIHSVGNVAPVVLVVNNVSRSKYTGVFYTGGQFGIIRLSPGSEPDPSKGTTCDPSCGFIPGISLKILRTGVASGNLFGLYSLVGQTSFNFFANNLTNHPPLDCDDVYGSFRLLYDKFKTASQYPTMIGLTQVALYDQDGIQYKPSFPYQLWFVPNPVLTASFPDSPGNNWTDHTLATQLASIPPGTVLYTMYALETPLDMAEELGYIQTTDAFTTSLWGDKNLFQEHTRMEEDASIHPDWLPYFPPTC